MQEQTQEQDSFHGSRFLMRLPQNQGGFTEGQVRCNVRTCCCRAPHMTTGAQFWLHSPESQTVPSPARGRAQPWSARKTLSTVHLPLPQLLRLVHWASGKSGKSCLKSCVQDLCGPSCLILASVVWSSILQPIHESHRDTHRHKGAMKQRFTTLVFASGGFGTEGVVCYGFRLGFKFQLDKRYVFPWT